MGTCQFCELPVERGRELCPNCGNVISQTLPAGVEMAGTDTTKREQTSQLSGSEKTVDRLPSEAAFQSPARYSRKDGPVPEKVETYILPNFDADETTKATRLPFNRAASEVVLGKVVADNQTKKGSPVEKGAYKVLKLFGILAFVIAGFLASYFYVAGIPGSNAAVEDYLNKVLQTRGFDVAAKMEAGGTVFVTGKVQSDDDRNAVLAIIRSHSRVKNITDGLKVVLSPAEIEQSLNRSLDGGGLGEVKARVGGDFIAILSGIVHDQQTRDAALAMARDQRGVKGVSDGIEIKKTSVKERSQATASDFTQTALFRVFALSPSAWASKKYSSPLTFRVPGPGRILMAAEWEQQGVLALMLRNAESHDTYVQKDGKSTLQLVYRITPQDLAKGSLWEAVVANFSSTGPMDGSLKIVFLGGDANRPFSTFLEQAFDANRVEGEINSALRTGGIRGVTAEVGKDRIATLTGSVKSLGEKQKAIETAKRFKAIRQVKDIIFVVG